MSTLFYTTVYGFNSYRRWRSLWGTTVPVPEVRLSQGPSSPEHSPSSLPKRQGLETDIFGAPSLLSLGMPGGFNGPSRAIGRGQAGT